MPSTTNPGFEPGVDAATRRALFDLRRKVAKAGGIKITGTIPTPGPPSLPGVDEGDIIIDSDGDGWVWDGDSWINIGPIQGPPGPAGPPGPPGPPGSGIAAFVHNQGVAAAVWDITHGMGYNPNITVIDSAGSVVEGDIVYTTVNSVRLTFSGAFAGVAYLS